MNAIVRLLDERSPRERQVLAAIAAMIAIALVAAFVWLPLERTRARLAAELPALRASIPALERDAQEAARLRAMPAIQPSAAEPLSALVAGSGARPLAGAQVSLVDNRTLRVTSSDVAFGALLEWIAAVQAVQGLRVESARIEALPAPGRVRAELRLTKG